MPLGGQMIHAGANVSRLLHFPERPGDDCGGEF
jgi:hypothetical protein